MASCYDALFTRGRLVTRTVDDSCLVVRLAAARQYTGDCTAIKLAHLGM